MKEWIAGFFIIPVTLLMSYEITKAACVDVPGVCGTLWLVFGSAVAGSVMFLRHGWKK